jgi:toxin CptA
MIDLDAAPSLAPSGRLSDANDGSWRAGVGSARFAAPWMVDIGPSRRLTAILVAAHLSAGAAVLLAAPPVPVVAAVLALVAFSGGYHVRCVARAACPGSVSGLRIDADGGLLVRHRDGRASRGRLIASTVVDWRLTLVRFRIDGERFSRTVPLVGDNCDAQAFRRLRVGLDWQAGSALLSRQYSD